MRPNAAACASVVRAPRSINHRATPRQLFASPILAVARPGLFSRSRFSDDTSPLWMASTTASARGLSAAIFKLIVSLMDFPRLSLIVVCGTTGTIAATVHHIPNRRDGETRQCSVNEQHMIIQEIGNHDQTDADRTDEQRTFLSVLPIGRYLPKERQGRHDLNQKWCVG